MLHLTKVTYGLIRVSEFGGYGESHKGIMLHIGMSGQNTLLHVKEDCLPRVLFQSEFYRKSMSGSTV